MLTSNFQNIDANQIATDRQVYGVACHFANIAAKSPSERYGLTKVFNAVIRKYYKDADSFMTHGDVTEFREWDCVPQQFDRLIKPSQKAVKVKKVASKKPKASAKMKASEAAPTVKKKITAIKVKTKASKKPTQGDRINALESRVDAVDSKLDAILNILQK